MAADNFFARWSNKSAELPHVAEHNSGVQNPAGNLPNTEVEPQSAPVSTRPLPTQDDLDQLTHESDFSVFMGKGVDEGIKRSAMKKLFSDPQFNIMDGLDIYIDDYTKFEAMTPSVLASLNHVKNLLDPLSRLEKSISGLLNPTERASITSRPLPILDEEVTSDKSVFVSADEEQLDVEKTSLAEKPHINEDKDSE